jgi:hypothetical protein
VRQDQLGLVIRDSAYFGMKSEELSLLRSPIRTLHYFSKFLFESLSSLVHGIATHPVVLYLIIPVVVFYLVVNNLDGSHQDFVTEFEDQVALAVWWIGLGVLSSVGLGI